MDESPDPPPPPEAAATLLTPPGKSPPGMKLRSGRKKRRRSRETTGLTPPESEKKKRAKKRAKVQEGSIEIAQDEDTEEEEESSEEEDDDEEMENVQDEHEPTEEEIAAETAAAQAAAATILAGEQRKEKAKQLPPIANLRMPSQHTPGQKKRAAVGNAVAGAAAASTEVASAAAADTLGAPPAAAGAYTGTRRLLFGAPAVATSNPPSEKDHTPASEELESILANPPPPAQQQPPTPSGRQDAVPRSLWSRSSDVLCTFTNVIQEVSTTLVAPQPERIHAQGEDGGKEEEETRGESSSLPLDQTLFWVVILLVVQVVLSLGIPFGFNPAMSALVASSNLATGFYQGILGGGQPVVVDMQEELQNKLPEAEVDVENPLVPLLESLGVSMDAMENNATTLKTELDEIRKSLKSQKRHLEDWDSLLKKAEKTVGNVLDAVTEGDNNVNTNGARLVLSKLETMLDTSFPLIAHVNVPLWDEEPTPCQASSPTTQDAILTPEELEEQKHELRQMARDAAKALQTDAEKADLVKTWIQGRVQEAMEETNSSPDDAVQTASPKLKTGPTLEEVQDVIDQRLETHLADQTGLVDYASLFAGASVIRSGPRATSPSLVDNLPLMNRLMSNLRLRFYGHGPEAALTPTVPADALGQCWSFERFKDDNTHRDRSNGRFGTLTIRLPMPLTVTGVVIEHPPKELTKQIESAIRDFRLFGYENDQATGTPWKLGSDAYKIDHKRVLQEFETETTTRDGRPIPKLHSITLAIDNNYGFDYTCLYRFRVHGDP